MFKPIAIAAAILSSAALALPAQAADPLKIGVLLPTSGVLAALAQEQINGMQIAVEEAGGSVAGRKIELIVEDTEAKPQVGLTKARKLILSNKVDVLAGVVSSAVALALAPYLARAKMPLVISNAGTNLLAGDKCERFVLRASYSMGQTSKPMGDYMAKKGTKTVYILASDYVAPREAVEAFKQSFIAAGGKIVGEDWTPFARTQDYGPYLSKARAAKPDAIFAVYYGGEAILFTKQYEAFGMKKQFPLYSAIGLTPPILRKAQGMTAADVVQTSNYISELPHPENRKFVEAYTKKFNQAPGEFAAYSYDTIRVILDAVKALNGDVKDKAKFVAQMEKANFVGPRGPIKLSSSGRDVVQNMYIVKSVAKDGQVGFELLETIEN